MPTDTTDLITLAVAAALKEAATLAVKGAVAGGKPIFGWIKSKLSGTNAALADEVAAAPEKASAPAKLQAVLTDLLEEQPGLKEELAALLKGLGVEGPSQTATIKGDNNQTVQIVGSGNSINK
jgi:hypothetical protein